MIINGISIRSKLLLATLVTLVLLASLALVYLDATQKVHDNNDLLDKRSAILAELHALDRTVFHIVSEGMQAVHEDSVPENSTARMSELIAESMHLTRKIESGLADLGSHKALAGIESVDFKNRQVYAAIENLNDDLRSVSGELSESIRLKTDMMVLGELMIDLDQTLSRQHSAIIHRNQVRLIFILVLGILIIGTYFILFAINLGGAFAKLTAFTNRLKAGQLPDSLDFVPGDEFGSLAGDLNRYVAELNKKIVLINSMSGDGSGEIFDPEEDDELGNALLVLSNYLTRKELDEVTRNREDKKQNWISEGVAQLGEVLRSERENVENLSFAIIQKLVTYMKVEMGSLYVASDADPQNRSLDLTASYAYDRRKYMTKKLQWGEGLPGTCALERKGIFLTDVPEDYFEISSGTGSSKPNCIFLVPLMIDDQVYGILELATVRLLRPFEIEFVESLAESIASSIQAVQINERTSELLKQSQAQAEALKSQETTMLENVKQLEEAQEESLRKETEISGILHAINQSTLVAELGLNGRYTSVNDRFLLVLESQRDQVLGKQHRDLAQVDPYSEEYKNFWSTLKEGQSISNMEMYKLVSGKEIWLQQTFTPIINNEGRVYKILNIATDITGTRTLQEQVETREHEITRRTLDIQTLNVAVNSALIKCDLDAEGIIMDVNDKYNEITGYGRKELLGRNYRLFLKEMEKEQFEKIWNEVSKQKVYEGVVRRTKPTGEEVWLVATFSPVIDEAGVIYKVYFLGFDITEKRLKYQLLEDANREIERLKDRLGEYEA